MELKRRLRAVLVLIWILPGDTKKVEMPSKEMEVVRGQMVVLQAWYSPSADISLNSVVWQFTRNESKQVINFSSGKVGHGQNEFTSRVGFSVAMPSANLSIYINDTQESDSGHYMCHVIVPGEQGLTGEMRLNVKGARVADERHGTLRLSNLTKSMSGKYICRASNTAGSDSCSINLEVITSSNAGMIAAATLGSVVGLVAMMLFLIFILRRRRDTEEEMANEIKEDAQAPKRVSWAKSNTGSDNVSKNGTLSSIATSPRSRDPHQPNFQYPYCSVAMSASDAGSVINAYHLRPGEASSLQGLPGYNVGGTPTRKHKRPPSTNGAPPQVLRGPAVASPKRTEGAQPQVAPQISSSTLTRMGGVAVMVPAQSQAGSLV
ncbi:endothelial cell-selective adhesion molecule [Kryptolebias marmoratus]|uniref:endothelial cell-selective adhesion molecule n=1 Tax=Kryptolebias marmoratus TaxID=37003 RepID=UPI0018ACBBCE|nr:endothelial cell-selective adhesion molecule [Kryptolebias marmoratus]